MCVWMTGLRSNISETEGGTNLGLHPNSENWALFHSRNRRFIIGEPDWDPKIQWK